MWGVVSRCERHRGADPHQHFHEVFLYHVCLLLVVVIVDDVQPAKPRLGGAIYGADRLFAHAASNVLFGRAHVVEDEERRNPLPSPHASVALFDGPSGREPKQRLQIERKTKLTRSWRTLGHQSDIMCDKVRCRVDRHNLQPATFGHHFPICRPRPIRNCTCVAGLPIIAENRVC